MKSITIFSLVGLLGLITIPTLGNPTDTNKNKKTYKRAFGSTKGIKECTLNTTHDASTKRVYNNSTKPTKLIEARPEIEESSNKRANNSVRSYNFKANHTAYIESNNKRVSPFRANKKRR